jgi:dTDP-4-amino-4,6-dideoxygalactose transaminase
VKELEAKLSVYFGGRPVRVFNSGTCTMEIALRIAGVGPGHEVITTPLSWVATSNVILTVGAKPVFVDIDPITRNIDLAKAEAAITKHTTAIIPVDLAGLPVDRDRLHALAKTYRLRVIEDAAQAFGSTWQGRRIGSFGDFTSISFHPNKNITTIEGGCLVMNDEKEAKLAEQYRLQGVVRTGFDGMDVEVVGGKFNLTDVAARVGLGQLPHIDAFNLKRRELARYYFELFDAPDVGSLGLGLPPRDFEQSNWHMFQVVLPDRLAIRRAEVMQQMHLAGIGSGVHYPAIHLFGVYRDLGWKDGDCPIAEKICRNILTLPLFPAMTREDAKRVVTELARIVRANLE